VPDSPRDRARILGCTAAQEKVVWSTLVKKFVLRGDAYINERLEEERVKQAEYRRRQSDKGKASAATRRQPEVNHGSTTVESRLQPGRQPEGNSSSASAFASSKETVKNTVSDAPARPIISGQANPRDWGRIHGNHVTGFCDWVCLPDFVFEEFRAKSPGPEYVKGWAAKVREKYEGTTIGEDGLKFWRRQWSDSHRTPTAEKPAFSIAEALAREAARKAGKAS
jgi:uncharacterized protein YdaU (DUF1376 family)